MSDNIIRSEAITRAYLEGRKPFVSPFMPMLNEQDGSVEGRMTGMLTGAFTVSVTPRFLNRKLQKRDLSLVEFPSVDDLIAAGWRLGCDDGNPWVAGTLNAS